MGEQLDSLFKCLPCGHDIFDPLRYGLTRGQAVKVGFRSTLNFFDAKNSSNDATKCCVEQVSAKL